MARRLNDHMDMMHGIVTIELSNGRCIQFDEKAYRELGISECLRMAGLPDEVATGRMPVIQLGQVVGTLPGDFDPMSVKSKSWLYDPRPGDFRLDDGKWIASNMLGFGDLMAVAGFAPT